MSKRRFKKFRIDELSSVDKPAQAHAKSVLMKRAPVDDDAINKGTGGVLLVETNGHTHLLVTNYGEGEMDSGSTRYGKATGASHDHSHPWTRNADGTITIGMSEGHTHEVPSDSTVNKGSTVMDKAQLIEAITKFIGGDTSQGEEIKKAAAELGMEDALPAALAKAATPDTSGQDAMTIALFTDVQKAHFRALDDDGRAEFLKMDDSARENEIAKAAKDNDDKIVYKSDTGRVYTAQDDADMVALAKRADLQDREIAKMRDAAQNAEIEKRADELIPHLGGGTEGRVALLKSVEAIKDDDERKKALESLKTANEAAKKNFEPNGTSQSGNGGGSEVDSLDNLAKQYAKDNNVPFEKAYTAVLDTPEGQDLYAKSLAN